MVMLAKNNPGLTGMANKTSYKKYIVLNYYGYSEDDVLVKPQVFVKGIKVFANEVIELDSKSWEAAELLSRKIIKPYVEPKVKEEPVIENEAGAEVNQVTKRSRRKRK
jgi:hypothetical protein